MQTAQWMEDVIGIKAGEERSRDLLESPVAAQPHAPVPLQQKHRNPPVGVVASSFKLGHQLFHQLAILNPTIHADQAIDRHPHLAAQARERRLQEIAAGGIHRHHHGDAGAALEVGQRLPARQEGREFGIEGKRKHPQKRPATGIEIEQPKRDLLKLGSLHPGK